METQSSGEGKDLLLHSMREFGSLIEPLLRMSAARSLCEIGVGRGLLTEFLVGYANANGCSYTAIDPTVSETIAKRHANERTLFLRRPSLEALAELPQHDAYFLDGDHNYYTVKRELATILRDSDFHPLIFLHDVWWPWGRRDQYCCPSSIPPDCRHASSASLGVAPGQSEPVAGGFCGSDSDYPYEVAIREGGARNGVLTAVEDFLAEGGTRGGWRLVTLPVVFGFGILCAPEACPAPARDFIRRIDEAAGIFRPLFERLERNRVDLFLDFLRAIKQFDQLHIEYGKLLQAYKDLERHAQALQASCDSAAKASQTPKQETI